MVGWLYVFPLCLFFISAFVGHVVIGVFAVSGVKVRDAIFWCLWYHCQRCLTCRLSDIIFYHFDVVVYCSFGVAFCSLSCRCLCFCYCVWRYTGVPRLVVQYTCCTMGDKCTKKIVQFIVLLWMAASRSVRLLVALFTIVIHVPIVVNFCIDVFDAGVDDTVVWQVSPGVIVLSRVLAQLCESAMWAPIVVVFNEDCGGVVVVSAFFVSSIVIG